MAEEVNYIGLLQRWQDIIAAHEESLKCFLEQSSPICREYERSEQQNQDDSFNVFYLISDLYYRENFHSDIIASLLDTREKHRYGNKFLSVFISLLNTLGCEINQENYRDAVAVREENRIDILVMSKSSKRAIIIENKINDAGDMPRQLPRYYDYVTDELKCKVEAIVYLPLKPGKTPDQTGWTENDRRHVLPLLIIIPAYDKSEKNLVDDWLHPLESITSNIDVLSTLRQYSRLIKQLNSNNMDTLILEKFYNQIKDGDNLKIAQSVRNMLNELPFYLARRIFVKYNSRCAPFSKVWIYSPNNPRDAVFEGAVVLGLYIKMDIWCSEDGYEVLFYSPADRQPDETVFNEIRNNVNSLQDFIDVLNEKCRITKHFDFTDDKGLFAFIDNILLELSKIKND